VGDLDGDGFSDLFYHCLLGAGIIAHACDAMPATATGFVVFFGSASGTLQPRDIHVAIPEDFRGHEKPIPADPVLWNRVVPTGDVDGDGRADLLAACVGTSGVHGFDVFMRGSRSGPQYAPELGFDATSSQYAPTNAYSDLDLDGFPDLITLRLDPNTSGSLLIEFGPRGSGRTQTLPFDYE
jgi:hypothetical protein